MAPQSYEAVQSEIIRLRGLAKKLKRKHTAAKLRARRKVLALMKKLGVSVSDLKGAKPSAVAATKPGKRAARKAVGSAVGKAATPRKRRARKVPIKYRGPNRGDTWTGRGKTPRWLATQIADGKKKEDFLIS